MMTNLFSIFDPSSFLMNSMNWVVMMSFMILLAPCIWINHNNWNNFFKSMFSYLYLEVKTVMLKANQMTIILIMSTFIMITYSNFLGLIPYIFNSTSHMSITMALALPSWLGLNLFGWINSYKTMMAHLVPQSTPTILMPFMVVIESTSNIIRPLTLAVRLSANMIAGHLLMTLMGNLLSSTDMTNVIPIMIPQILLSTLEMAVSVIQAYVFSILIALYINEIPN